MKAGKKFSFMSSNSGDSHQIGITFYFAVCSQDSHQHIVHAKINVLFAVFIMQQHYLARKADKKEK